MRQLVMFFPESLLLTLWYILPFGNQLCIKELCNYVNVLLRPYKIKSHLINKETNNSGGDGHRFSLPWAGQSIMDLSVKSNWDSHCHLYECQTIYMFFPLNFLFFNFKIIIQLMTRRMKNLSCWLIILTASWGRLLPDQIVFLFFWCILQGIHQNLISVIYVNVFTQYTQSYDVFIPPS